MSVRLRPYLSDDKTTVEQFEVAIEQAPFVEPVSETLATEHERDNYVIEVDGLPIGFFQVDHSSGLQCLDDHLELHEVLIDQSQQGKGYGKAFVEMLPDFLRIKYPGRRGVCLTVNCRNQSAKRLYELGGFANTGDLKLEGRSGPQFIMRRDL